MDSLKTSYGRRLMRFIYTKCILYSLFFYWMILVIWQNAFFFGTRSVMDIIFKMFMLAYLVFSFIKIRRKFSNQLLIGLFVLTQIFTFFMEKELSMGVLISYIYSCVIIVLVYGIGNRIVLKEKEVIIFLNSIIGLSLFAAIYAIIFCTKHFISVFQITNAYGNELMSFFESSHEYGLYISAAIVCCIICIDITKKEGVRKRIFYFVALMILIPNLILTFSRTAILGLVCYGAIYIFFAGKSVLRKWIYAGILFAIVMYLFVPDINMFVNNIVFKKNNLAGRGTLVNVAIDLFKQGSLIEKLFGYGIYYSREYVKLMTSHESVHNAYLQVLLQFGVVGLFWFVGALVKLIADAIKVMKYDRYWGATFLGIVVWASAMMMTNTFLIFTSSIDCYFLTIFAIIMPKYAMNSFKKLGGINEWEIRKKKA